MTYKGCTCLHFPAGFCFTETAQRKWLCFRRNHPTVGTFTALNQLMSPILSTDVNFRFPNGTFLKTRIC